MTDEHSLRGLLHRATHRIPGVPASCRAAGRAPGHGGSRATRVATASSPHPSLNHRWNHSPARPPRFMPAWQRRIAAFFGREL